MDNIPYLPGFEVLSTQCAVWCPYCGIFHYHARAADPQRAMCKNGRGEYFIVPTGKPFTDEMRRADRLGQMHFSRYKNCNTHPSRFEFKTYPTPAGCEPLDMGCKQ